MNYKIANLPENVENINAIKEVLKETGDIIANDGIEIVLKQSEKELHIVKDEKNITIEYPTRSALLRAIGIITNNKDKKLDITQEFHYEHLAPMVDFSRNSVMNKEAREKFIREIALMGYNALMFYTEETYKIDETPYFGHQRGALTPEELHETDDYCALLGIELIPCIQTLAHLNAFFEWSDAQKYRDTGDILLIGEEKTYQLIESMISSMSNNVRSRKINIGMDEAEMVGRGKYLNRHGFVKASELMKEHLAKVVEICNKYNYKPMMWSDMFFKMPPNGGNYYNPENHIVEEIANCVPKEISVVYWDYYGLDAAKYHRMFEEHMHFNNPVNFAGGTSCWYGLLPLTRYSIASARTVLGELKNFNVNDVLVTMWGDNGGMCSPFASLPTLMLYAEDLWGAATDDEALKGRLKRLFKLDYDAFMAFEDPQNVPGRLEFGSSALCPTRYLFYQDALLGTFDYHVKEGTNLHFSKMKKVFKDYENGQWGYLFDTAEKLCKVLENKAELGCNLKNAYDNGDKKELTNIIKKVIPTILKDIDEYYLALRYQWMTDYKAFGFEIQEIRIGALKQRLVGVQTRVKEYLDGKITKIPELEASRLPYTNVEGPVKINRWAQMVSTSVL